MRPPQQVVTYAREAPAPTDRDVVKEAAVVARPHPETVVVVPVPENPNYAFAIVDDERVLSHRLAR